MWILRVLAQFKGSEVSPGLLQDFEDGYIKFKTPHHIILYIEHSVVVMTVCTFLARDIPVRNLRIVNFRFSFYEICVQNSWGHKTLRP